MKTDTVAEWRKRRRIERSLYIYKYLSSHACENCWENRPVCLEFHHAEPSIKSFDLWIRVSRDRSIASINKEIEKCVVLCANCHKVITAKQQWRYNFLNTPD